MRTTLLGTAVIALAGLAVLNVASSLVSNLHAQTPATAPAAQPQRPTFRTGVEYIEVDAHVVDGRNNPVPNLKKEDFRLFEDGKEQAIETFSAIDIPIESASSTTETVTIPSGKKTIRVEPDVAGNHYSADNSRVFIIVLDDLEIDPARTFATRRIARTFIERNLGSHDLAAVLTTGGRTDLQQTLTSNKALLLKVVDAFLGQKLEPEGSALERFSRTTAALNAIQKIAEWMGGIRGRSKVMMLVSQGVDFNTDDCVGNPLACLVLEEEQAATAAATRANVTIYGIDPRGLYAPEELSAQQGSFGSGLAAAPKETGAPPAAPQEGGSTGPTNGGAERAFATAVRQRLAREQMSLRVIADETGGAVSFQNDFEVVLDRIVRQHSTYYLLGYYPTNPRREGKTRDITVRVNGRGFKVTARSGYREAKANGAAAAAEAPGPSAASAELRDALNSPLPLDGIALTATGAAFRGDDGKGTIAIVVETPAGTVDVVEQDGKFTGSLEQATVAVDARNGMAGGDTTKIALQLTADTAARLKDVGFRTLSKLDGLGPGRYQVRVAVGTPASGRRGSVWYDVEVPDFSKGALSMSGLLIGSSRHDKIPTGNSSNVFADLLPVRPTAARQFTPDDELMAFVELYAHAPAGDTNVTAIIRGSLGQEVVRREQVISPEGFETGDVYRSITNLPLAELTPGNYVVTVEAVGAKDDGPIVRAAPFRVVR